MTFAGINYLAILIAAVAGWLTGALYYGVLGKQWVAAQGRTMEEFKARQAEMIGKLAAGGDDRQARRSSALHYRAPRQPGDGLGAGGHRRAHGHGDHPQRGHLGAVRVGWFYCHHHSGEQRFLGPQLCAHRHRRGALAFRAARYGRGDRLDGGVAPPSSPAKADDPVTTTGTEARGLRLLDAPPSRGMTRRGQPKCDTASLVLNEGRVA